ncbi:unnamed protein product [Effrenium voratum]|uniref:Uncharacterized protein n=1 Tax=Effrenium voratum TaxID=2562239 RepID=A0AA36HP62_9DINO|nr:unnamed protein product [Effrenium voratum]CAJ1435420.1 unnamed protein product [Effrenium voratum]
MGASSVKGVPVSQVETFWDHPRVHRQVVSFEDAKAVSGQATSGKAGKANVAQTLKPKESEEAREKRWLNDVQTPGRLKRTVVFPVGDWFLGVGDGGIGRDKDNPAGGALIMKGSLSDFDEEDRPPKWDTMTDDTEDKALQAFGAQSQGDPGQTKPKVDKKAQKKAALGKLGLDPSSEEFKQSHEPPPGGWTNNARAGVTRLPMVGYGGELQLLEDFRSQTIRFSDLTDSSRFSCQQSAWGPGPGGPGPVPTQQGYPHPQIELDHPESYVHVHLEDRAAGPVPHVLWDAAYDMGGTEVLKSAATAMWGTRPNMELFCPPKHGPPHWFELTISRMANARRRPYMMQDFIASQVISAYRPDHDPQLDAFSMAVDQGNSAEAAKAL